MPADTMPTMYFKYRGTFDQKKLMQGIQQWYIDNNYKFHAAKYKIKASEAEYEANGEHEITEFVKFWVGIHMWIRDLVDVEVIQEGEKKKMQEGYINLDINGKMEYDYTGRFGGSKFMQWLYNFYHKYVIRQTIKDVWEDDVILKMQELEARVKDLIGVEVS